MIPILNTITFQKKKKNMPQIELGGKIVLKEIIE